jgi:hypothetical protein
MQYNAVQYSTMQYNAEQYNRAYGDMQDADPFLSTNQEDVSSLSIVYQPIII